MTRQRGLLTVLTLAALGAAGCTSSLTSAPSARTGTASTVPVAARAAMPAGLDAFRSCRQALAGLRHATSASVTAYGLPDDSGGLYQGPQFAMAASDAASAGAAALPGSASGSATPAYSGTNVAVSGVDEPDLVKTDGHRIVMIEGNVLTVVDAATRKVTGTLRLGSLAAGGYLSPGGTPGMAHAGPAFLPLYGSSNLLLSGDHALVLGRSYGAVPGARPSQPGYVTRLLLVDLPPSSAPRVISAYTISGQYVDARMVGSVARVITQTAPRVVFPGLPAGASQARTLAANRATVGRAGLSTWLPAYSSSTAGGKTASGSVPCTSVSHPPTYSGTGLLTVGTFDLAASALGTGSPVAIVANGDTVYGTASSLYIASGNQWGVPLGGASGGAVESEPAGIRQQTQIYRFSLAGSGAPRFAASGTVPGYLVDQYAMSEWNGHLRVATTTGLSWALADGPSPAGAKAPPSASAVYELSLAGSSMRVVGKVSGLGSGERIYSVRFVGPVGYVVTFRQTDPLYTVDLSDPLQPRVVGNIALTGYSAYLHPVSPTELIGVGQSADRMGHVGGIQVSLFSVASLAAPARLATYALAGSSSLAESDPHAFLYWPASGLVVVPLYETQSGDLVLRLSGGTLVRVGPLRQPDSQGYPIERSLVIGTTLWTLSPAGLMASDPSTLHQQAWLPLSIA
jgi:uncharacterized secreted protein with C-terminal beta-propeller domain